MPLTQFIDLQLFASCCGEGFVRIFQEVRTCQDGKTDTPLSEHVQNNDYHCSPKHLILEENCLLIFRFGIDWKERLSVPELICAGYPAPFIQRQ